MAYSDHRKPVDNHLCFLQCFQLRLQLCFQLVLPTLESQLPRPRVRGLRLRKKSCRIWLVDLWVANPQSFMDFSRPRQPALHRDLDAVEWSSCFCLIRTISLWESCHAKRLSFVHRLSLVDPECPTFRRRRKTVPWQIDIKELRFNRSETTSNRVVRGESNLSRGTIHPHPKGCGLLYPLTPRDKTQRRTDNHIYPHGSALSIISLPAVPNAMIIVRDCLSFRLHSIAGWPLLDRDILDSRILDLMLLLGPDALPKSI